MLEAGDLTGKVRVASKSVVIAVHGVDGKFTAQNEQAVMNQKYMRFIPRILPIMVGGKVQFPNNERNLYHNVYSVSEVNEFNLGTYRAGTAKSVTFNDTGIVEIMCSIHVRMYAAIIVLANPFFSIVNDDGTFIINDIPPGRYNVDTYYIGDYEVVRERTTVNIPLVGQAVFEAN